MVPVLSSATICVLPVCSSEAAVLKRIPFFAPIPLPTIIATGVARPSAQGQLMTRTDIPRARAYPNPASSRSQTIVVMTAIAITAGTKTPETLSAVFAIGAFVAAASLTIRMIFESVVSSPTRVASQRRKPLTLTVAALTLSPGSLSTGMLSPVRAASFTALPPEITTPSTGMLPPGRTTKISPFLTCPTGTAFSISLPSAPFLTTVASFGESCISPFRASVVLPFEIDSSIFPTVMRVRIIAALSKYRSCRSVSASPGFPAFTAAVIAKRAYVL